MISARVGRLKIAFKISGLPSVNIPHQLRNLSQETAQDLVYFKSGDIFSSAFIDEVLQDNFG